MKHWLSAIAAVALVLVSTAGLHAQGELTVSIVSRGDDGSLPEAGDQFSRQMVVLLQNKKNGRLALSRRPTKQKGSEII